MEIYAESSQRHNKGTILDNVGATTICRVCHDNDDIPIFFSHVCRNA
jgi:hypothetical protein